MSGNGFASICDGNERRKADNGIDRGMYMAKRMIIVRNVRAVVRSFRAGLPPKRMSYNPTFLALCFSDLNVEYYKSVSSS